MRSPNGSLSCRVRLAAICFLTLCASAACGSGGGGARRLLLPPRLDLAPYGHVGLVLFTMENAKGTLDQLATARFSEDVLEAQPGIEVLEVGSADSVRQRVGETDYGPATAQALGASRDVPVVFVGHLKVSNVKTSGGFAGLTPHLESTVSVELSVALYSTKSGGTLWRGGGIATGSVGGLALSGGIPIFSAQDPKAAYGRLVNEVVDYATRDLWSHWQEQ